MKPYIEKINGGGASLKSEYRIVSETANTAVIDAQGGLGAIAGEKAVAVAREKAKTNLISIVSVKNSNHFGMAGHWAMKLAGDDCIGFACSNTDPSMAPPGVTIPFIGNNPFSFAFAAGKKISGSMCRYGNKCSGIWKSQSICACRKADSRGLASG